LIRGTLSFDVVCHCDARGELVAFDRDSNLGFVLQRVFFIRVDFEDAVRAEHACSAEQVLLVLSGAVTVDIDNGRDHCTLQLRGDDRALRVSAGVWLRLRNFRPGTVLSVAASRTYADTVYFDRAQPELIAAS
jgi:dTDP-4-dehydrorhamnose 3,5-epimerase